MDYCKRIFANFGFQSPSIPTGESETNAEFEAFVVPSLEISTSVTRTCKLSALSKDLPLLIVNDPIGEAVLLCEKTSDKSAWHYFD